MSVLKNMQAITQQANGVEIDDKFKLPSVLTLEQSIENNIKSLREWIRK